MEGILGLRQRMSARPESRQERNGDRLVGMNPGRSEVPAAQMFPVE